MYVFSFKSSCSAFAMVYFPLLSFVVIYWGNRPEPLKIRGPDFKPFSIVFQGPLVHYLPIEITRSESLLPSQKKCLLSKPVNPLSLFDLMTPYFYSNRSTGTSGFWQPPRQRYLSMVVLKSVYHLHSVTWECSSYNVSIILLIIFLPYFP